MASTSRTGFKRENFASRGPGYLTDHTILPARRFNRLSDRFELRWVAGQRGKPGLNADVQNAAEATRMVADPDFEILGTNATSGSSAFGPEGGVVLTTAGADADQVILCPHLDANQTAWTQVTWGTDRSVEWECDFKTGLSIAATILWAGLKLTNTPTGATDNDQVFLRYQNGVSSGAWVLWTSIGGTDTTTVTSFTVATSTRYRMKVKIDASRICQVFLASGASPVGAKEYVTDWTCIYTTAALTDATDLIPYIGVQASGAAAAKSITVYGQAISRTVA